MYVGVSEDDSSSECSSDSDIVNVRPSKDRNTSVTGSGTESGNETHSARECPFASTEEWMEGNISQKVEDFTVVSGVTVGYNNPQSVCEISGLIFGHPK